MDDGRDGRMERKISYDIYLYAFVISLAIFVIGIYIGTLLDAKTVSGVKEEVSTLNERMNTILLMGSFEDPEALCPLYKDELKDLGAQVESIGSRLWFLEEEKGVQDLDLKRRYFMLESQAIYLTELVNRECGGGNDLVLYFYTNKDGMCPRCDQQGVELYRFGQDNGVRVYSFDGELGGATAEVMKAKYGITSYPATVVNGKAFNRYMSKTDAEEVLKND